MPEVLDRCVLDLRRRGVSESSAFAICTSSLQKSGRLPRVGTTDRAASFDSFATAVSLPAPLRAGLAAVYDDITPPDKALLRRTLRVEVTDRPGVLGLAVMGSRVFAMSPTTLGNLGNKPIWYGAVALHESVHSNLNLGEHEATQIEQRFAGKRFGEGMLGVDRVLMFDALNITSMAQAQRSMMVHHNHRRRDFSFLTSVGFTPKMTRRIMSAAEKMLPSMRANLQKAIDAPGRPIQMTHQFYAEFLPQCEEMVNKAIDEEMTKLYLGALGDVDVLKGDGGNIY